MGIARLAPALAQLMVSQLIDLVATSFAIWPTPECRPWERLSPHLRPCRTLFTLCTIQLTRGYIGTQVEPPPETGVVGSPLTGEDDSYLGLCSYACDHGYCPDTACQAS